MARTGSTGVIRPDASLRKVCKTDAQLLAEWLPAVAVAARAETWADPSSWLATSTTRSVLLYSDPAGDAVVVIEQDAPMPNAARIEFVAVPPDRRRLGIGGRAVMATEHALRKRASCIYVAVRAEIGIALYFWLRLGYRPLLQGDWPNEPVRDVAWMRRDGI